MRIEGIVKENQRRLDIMNEPYDPMLGIGSPIERFTVKVYKDGKDIHIPISMKDLPIIHELEGKSFEEAYGDPDKDQQAINKTKEFNNLRLDHDFEFWAVNTCKIQDKESKQEIPFVCRRPQRKTLKELEDMRIQDIPIRLIILKARQWGGSTLVQVYMAWIQARLKTNWHSAICADVDDQAKNIRGMYSRLASYYPKELGTLTFTPYEGSTKTKIIKERGCIIGVGSVKSPDTFRSYNYSMSHLCLHGDTLIPTEDGFFKPVRDLTIHDSVITHNGHKAKVRCVTGNKPDWRNGNGKSVIIKTWLGFDTEMTPNHPVYTRDGWKKAENISKDDFLSLPVRRISNKISDITLPLSPPRRHGGGRKSKAGGATIPLNKDFGFTVGYYLAEGSVHLSKDKKVFKETVFTRHRDDVELSNKAVLPLKHLGVKEYVKDRKDSLTTQHTVFCSVLSEWLYKNLGAKEFKRIPDWFFDTNVDFLKGVLEGYLMGDGSRDNCNSQGYDIAFITVTSISSSLVTQIRDLALSLGFGLGGLKIKKSGMHYGRNCKTAYILSWGGESARSIRKFLNQDSPNNGHSYSEKSFIDGGFAWVKVKNVSEGRVDHVYDVEVDHPDHSFRTALFSVKNSEVGLWEATPMRSPEDLAQSLRSTIPYVPYTVAVVESTAKGVGNFFHQEWDDAVNGKSKYRPVFVAWFEIEIYQMPIDDYEAFISTFTDKHWYLWELGATLEGINWYFTFKEAERYDDWTMNSEFPPTPEEAFQSTGRRYFPPMYIINARKTVKEPLFIGDTYPNSLRGNEALEGIEFQENPKGDLWIWNKPNDPAPPEGMRVTNRYASFVDIGGKTAKADYSVVSVFDRYWMMEGGEPCRVATWRGHLDQDLFAWKAAQVSKYYENAFMAVETNSLRKDENTEGDHALMILDEIADYYRNMFTRTSPEQVIEGISNKWGFHTNIKTKTMILDNLVGLFRDNAYVEYDRRALDEADVFEITSEGKLGAKKGKHDDLLITTAGALWLCTQHMPPPKLVPIKTTLKPRVSTGHAPIF